MVAEAGGCLSRCPHATSLSPARLRPFSKAALFSGTGSTKRSPWVANQATAWSILSSTGTLLASDYLAHTGITYLNHGLRGLEPGDLVSTAGVRQISVDFTANSPGSDVHVLTAFSPGAVPEPSAFALACPALAGLVLNTRERNA